MRFPICQRFCDSGSYDDYNFDIAMSESVDSDIKSLSALDPYIICDCYYSRRILTYNTPIAKEMSGSTVTIPVPIVRSSTTLGPSPISISNTGVITPPRTPVIIPSPNTTCPMKISMPNNFSPSIIPINTAISSSQAAGPISSKLTVYSRSGHIVQKYGADTKTVTLPKSVEIASIVAVGSDGVVIPFSYVPETNMGIALVDRSTGEKVDATVIKEDKSLKGKILSLDSDNVMLMSNGEISNIREYDRVTVGITDDYTRPRLILNGNDSMSQANEFTLSYLLSSIAWSCVGTALIDNNKNVMYLRLAGNIVNNTESDITAETVLVSGDVYQYRRDQDARAESAQYAPRAMMVKSAPMSSKRVETSMLEDYVKYQVGNRIVRNKDVAELGTWSFPIIKLYVHQTNDNDTVRFGYRFTAPGFIPSCSLNVYSIDKDNGVDAYLGSNEIEQSQKNDEIDIILGESTMLQCKSEIIVTDVVVPDQDTARHYDLPLDTFQQHVKGKGYNNDSNWHIITEDLKVDITNHNDKPSALVLKHYIGGKKLVDLRCQAYKDKKNGYIEWYFQVPPKSGLDPRKESFSCQIITASYY